MLLAVANTYIRGVIGIKCAGRNIVRCQLESYG
jgi:hypothetical protein